ncbi:MAG: S8 family serine peptidase, partial [bacterium]
MRVEVCPSVRCVLIVVAALLLLQPVRAQGQSTTDKLDPVLQARSRQLTGRSRVIVEFRGEPDVRVITGHRGVAGRQLVGAQVAEIDNSLLATMAASPQVSRLVIDRPAFGTLERTGAAIGATGARQEFGLTGKGVGVAVIDSGITAWHEDLYLSRGRAPGVSERVVHFKDFTGETSPGIWRWEHPWDDYGHGTHVAGIISGNGFASDGARTGVAPGAS